MAETFKPLCFVLMPFGQKTDASGRRIDFDKIYDFIISEALHDAGMSPIRADQETTGGIIHKAMFERLILCPFAVADLTLGNPNVYYELGVRHAFRPHTTALLHAQGAKPPFDVAPDRYIPYSLDEHGNPDNPEETKASLITFFGDLKSERAADSPVYQLIDNLSEPSLDHLRTDSFRQRANDAHNYITEIRAAVRQRDYGQIHQLQAQFGDLSETESGILFELLLAYRDLSAWEDMERLVSTMPAPVAQSTMVREQLALALNRKGGRSDSYRAEQIITQLICEDGGNAESFGILGRIYKDRWKHAIASDPKAASGYLNRAIENYYKGFLHDPRDAFPGINALTLMTIRDGSTERTEKILSVVEFAVRRKIELHGPDYWDHATLIELGAISGDRELAEQSYISALSQDPMPWQCETTANNLDLILQHLREAENNSRWIRSIQADLESRT